MRRSEIPRFSVASFGVMHFITTSPWHIDQFTIPFIAHKRVAFRQIILMSRFRNHIFKITQDSGLLFGFNALSSIVTVIFFHFLLSRLKHVYT
jgi:hypothetical protein